MKVTNDDAEIESLLRTGVYKDKETLFHDAIKAFFITKPNLRYEIAIDRYRNKEISLWKAAETAGLTIEEFKELLSSRGIKVAGLYQMNLEDTLKALNKAIEKVVTKDKYLLLHNLSERTITHKLAEYLQPLFSDFNVDCEYNRNADNIIDQKKLLEISEDEMLDIAKDKIREDETYSVYPDIIIHNRGNNENNYLVIEVKKTQSDKKYKKFDYLKLKKFTTQYRYRLGAYLEFKTGKDAHLTKIIYYQKGNEREVSKLMHFDK